MDIAARLLIISSKGVAGMSSGNDQSLAGLAKRWLKTQFNLTGDPHKGRSNAEEAESIERAMENRVEDEVGRSMVNTLLPKSWNQKLDQLEDYQEQQRALAVQRRREEHAARPRAHVDLTFRGDVEGQIVADVPVRVTEPLPDEDAQSLAIELEALDPIQVGSRGFTSLLFAIPAFRGAGRYDLASFASGPDADSFDYTLYGLTFGQDEETFYWTPEYGPAILEVDSDERTVRVNFALEDAGGTHIDLSGSVALPS
jgi:hypothetical protein